MPTPKQPEPTTPAAEEPAAATPVAEEIAVTATELSPMDAMLAADAAVLSDIARETEASVDRYLARRNNRVADPIALPAAALIKNLTANAETWGKALVEVLALAPQVQVGFTPESTPENPVARFADTTEAITGLMDLARQLQPELVAHPRETEALLMASQMRETLANRYMVASMDAEVREAAESAVAAMTAAHAKYADAYKASQPPVVARQRGRGVVTTPATTPASGTPTAPVANLNWLQTHGWLYQWECSNCHDRVHVSISGGGSLQNDLTKHWASCHEPGTGRTRVYEVDDPQHQAVWAELTNAIKILEAGQEYQATGAGITLTRVDQPEAKVA